MPEAGSEAIRRVNNRNNGLNEFEWNEKRSILVYEVGLLKQKQ